jgi:hypothetical protein
MRNRVFVLLSTFVLLNLLQMAAPATVDACSCYKTPRPIEEEIGNELRKADAVFSGRVIGVRDRKSRNQQGEELLIGKAVLFEVENTWKGVNRSQVIVNTGFGGGDCGYPFDLGASYLVYAIRSTSNNNLDTGTCGRILLVTDTSEYVVDFAILPEGKPPVEKVHLEEPGEFILYQIMTRGGLIVVSFGVISILGLFAINRITRTRN